MTSCLSRPVTAVSRRAMRLGAEGAAMLAHSGVVTAVSRRAMRLRHGRPRGGQVPERERKGSMVAAPTRRRSASRAGRPRPPMIWGGIRQVKNT